MRRIMIGLAASALGIVALTGTADASPRGGHRSGGHAHAYSRGHGHRFSGGHFYRGRNHHFWTRTVWDPVCHRYQYWDPYYSAWYYWSAANNCYYPTTYVCP